MKVCILMYTDIFQYVIVVLFREMIGLKSIYLFWVHKIIIFFQLHLGFFLKI